MPRRLMFLQSPAVTRSHPAAAGPAPRFGAAADPPAPGAPAPDWTDYTPVFARRAQFQKYGTLDLPAMAEHLSPSRQALLENLRRFISPEQLEAMYGARKMGIMEECADMLFEYYALQALEGGFLSPDRVKDTHDAVLRPAQEGGLAFKTFFEQVAQSLDAAEVDGFARLCKIDDRDQAQILLALTLVKFAIFYGRDPEQQMVPLTQKRLMGEADELLAEIQGFPLRRRLLKPLTRVFGQHAKLPTRAFRLLPVSISRRALDVSISNADLLRFANIKQMGRQELDYRHPELSYNQRKHINKPLEALYEAFFLKKNGLDVQG